ncbi:MAG TPA: DUF11 domain-containing protein [Fluviicoccus sp.]|nr:DUF11 domain-containing protein [Fluviicoccus sp.]
MSNSTVSQARLMRSPWRFNQLALSVALVMGGVVALPGTAFAAAPDAGQVIGNTASATYSDGSGVTRNATSNNVNTSVLQVASFTLTSNNTKYVTLGGQVVYPHTLTNTGNGTDTFQLNAANQAGTDFNLGTLRIYADADNNGIADDAVNLIGQTVSLPRDGVFTFVVVGSAPSTGIADGDSAVVDVTADSQVYEGNVTEDPADVTNVDTAILTADAVINVVKSANVSQGLTGTLITYTLAYTNSGNNTATGVTLTDVIPAGTTYVAGSGKWNGATQTDAVGAPDDVFSITGSTITAAIGSVGQNVSGEIKFTVQVDSSTAPGFLNNTAQFSYDPDGGGVKPAVGPTNSNTVPFEVLQTRNVGANDSTSNSDDGTPAGDDTVTQGPVAQGATVWFANKIWNQGNGTDSFDITLSGSNFPAGTIFTLYKDDQSNVLLDTTGNVTPDTGPLAAGGSYTVYVKAVLPATVSGNNGGAGYDVVVTATSTTTGSVVAAGDEDDTVTDHLTAITANTVDIENAGGLADGSSITNGGAAWTPITTDPNTSVTFLLKVQNTSAVPDTFRLLADDDGTFGVSNDLPASWTVSYKPDGGTGDCSTTTAISVVDTGLIVAGGEAVFCAVVSVPQFAAPGTTNIYFRASSDTYGTLDTKMDSVTVNTKRNISLVSSQSNTVYPGGSVDYLHTITNNGNVLEGDGVASSVALATSGNLAGWSSVIYWDQDNNGSVTGDPVVTDLSFVSNAAAGLAPGESINLIVKVQSPGSALDATSNVTNVTATASGVISSVAAPTIAPNADTTTVNAGQIRLYKTQALDAACDGTADGAFANTALSAKPGACIIYKIEAKNEGSQPATSVVLSDATPAFTSLEVVGGRPSVTQGSITTPAVPASGYTGNVSASFGTINGGQSATMEMAVQIDN